MSASPSELPACRWVTDHVDAFVDGELDAPLHVEFDRHLAVCGACGDHVAFARSLRGYVRAAMAVDAPAPAHLRARILASMDRADAEGALSRSGVVAHAPAAVRPLAVPTTATALLSLASAAVLTLVYVNGLPVELGGGAVPGVQAAGLAPSAEDVVRVHQGLRRVGHAPAGAALDPVLKAPQLPRARLESSRVVSLGDGQPAVTFVYSLDGERVTLVVVERRAFRRPSSAQRVRYGDRPLEVVRVGRHAVPVFERDGLTYALTGDLDEHRLLQLASHAQVP